MIKRVLFLLFNVDAIPSYKARPDLKDCEYVLGYFCEVMFRESCYTFSRDRFLSILNKCCQERFIDLDVHVVFDVLHLNNIIVRRGYQFSFKFVYWIHYFAAQRMHHDKQFADFIYEDMRYAQYPEIIEFYTGIDRRREDALQALIRDTRAISDAVRKKVGIPDGMNPYKFAQWTPSPAAIERMQTEISEGVRDSNLPASVKDRYADELYDPSKPYRQEIQEILSEHSFVYMMQVAKAASNALRNSDYVDPDVKRQLLKEILECWQQATKVLLILLPILADSGHANFDGTSFSLSGDNWGDTKKDRFNRILIEIPDNVVRWSKDSLVSQKMGPLLIDQFSHEPDDLKKHELALVLIKLRPRKWKESIEKYISTITKNSFYLLDVYCRLRSEYQYSYATSATLKEIEYLIKVSAAKHATGDRLPGEKTIKKLNSGVIPERNVN
jgi:hypothetical protein